MRCGNGDDCRWEGPLGQYHAHSTKCPNRVVFCPKKCLQADGTPYQCLLKDLERHLELDCHYRTSECPHCYQEGTYKSLREEHLEICPFVLTKCPHSSCGAELASCLLLFHLSTDCEHAPVECKYRSLGCPVTLSRGDMEVHQEDRASHFLILTEAVSNLKLELATAQREICCMQEDRELEKVSQHKPEHNAVTFKLSDISAYHHKDFSFDRLYSSADKRGYRLSVKILPNNDGYVSIDFFLMKGHNDDNLEWPFRGKISVELLNQARDGDHYQKMIDFPRTHGQRVMETAESKQGIGIAQFIAVRELQCKYGVGRKKIQYLVDNCLFFRVTISPRIKNTWLTCSS